MGKSLTVIMAAFSSWQSLALAAPTNTSQSGTAAVDDSYLGYQGSDFNEPWAHYWNPNLDALTDEFNDGLSKSPFAASYGVSFEAAKTSFSQPGYETVENGYTIFEDGSLSVAVRTDHKYVTGEMLDWWVYWHRNSTTKYKLWHPSAHRYSVLEPSGLSIDDISKQSIRERYWNETYSVDEYIGNTATTISIGFYDASPLGFTVGGSASTADSNPAGANHIETLVAATSTLGIAGLDIAAAVDVLLQLVGPAHAPGQAEIRRLGRA